MQNRTLEVQGKGQISCKPDTIGISFTLSHKDDDYGGAYDGLNQRVKALREAMEVSGIKKDSLKTSSFHIAAQTRKLNEAWVFDGYLATHAIHVEILDKKGKEKINTAINVIAHAEAVSSVSIYYQISDPAPYRDEAIARAVKQAKHNAEILSQSAGIGLGPILQIQYGRTEISFRRDYGGMELRSLVLDSGPDIEPSEIDISESVAMVFQVA